MKQFLRKTLLVVLRFLGTNEGKLMQDYLYNMAQKQVNSALQTAYTNILQKQKEVLERDRK